jgi:signal transduction histidine kinase
MNAVVGLTELLKETHLTPEQLEMLETIEHSSESLLTIINDILDFSRLESKKLVLESVPVNLREVCACVSMVGGVLFNDV